MKYYASFNHEYKLGILSINGEEMAVFLVYEDFLSARLKVKVFLVTFSYEERYVDATVFSSGDK